jgi:hypothetical protein
MKLGLGYGNLETNNLIIYILQSEWSDTRMDVCINHSCN